MAVQLDRWTIPNPGLKITRSRFEMPHTHTTTINAGSLYPAALWEVLPGDTFQIPVKSFVRMQTPIHPVMDNAFFEVFFFFVPNRLTWEHWKEFMGESQDPFMSDTEYTIPQINFLTNKKGSIYDHYEIPLFTNTNIIAKRLSIDALPIRGYGLIWNEWFRDQNVSHALDVPVDDSTVSFANTIGDDLSWFAVDDDMTLDWMNGRPLPVAKYHDLFTSALPQPQRGELAAMPLTSTYAEGLPVFTSDTNVPYNLSDMETLRLVTDSGSNTTTGYLVTDGQGNTKTKYSADAGSGTLNNVLPVNLFADTAYTSITIDTFRRAYAIQSLLERDARSGNRYVEYVEAAFGVRSPDGRQQRPEFIGGKRIPLTMTQVPQTSATDSVSPQGNTAAFSLTRDYSDMVTYSATEHGFIHCLICVRTEHTYQQGIDRHWFRKRRFDFYDPMLANLSEMGIQNQELVYIPGASDNEEIFGYNEAWYEYRYKQSRVTGEMSSMFAQSLDVWHYGDIFGEWNADRTTFTYDRPTLSPEFIYETRENIDRTLAVQSSNANQFFVQLGFDTVATRPLPLYSIPGLAGHF